MPAEWSVRRASTTDMDAVLAIEQGCAEAPRWSHAVWRGALAEDEGAVPERASFVVENVDEILGFAVASCAGAVAELENIAVREAARCRGIGRALCREAIDWSRSRGARVIELEVRASSAGALALYRSLGFMEQGRRLGYYRDPTEDAVLMCGALQR
jgi:ribosomal-protein-alanine N-acetyltransferase